MHAKAKSKIEVAAPPATDVDIREYFALMLQSAADKFPNAGILLIVTDDDEEHAGELISLSNMGDEEMTAVLELAQDGHDDAESVRVTPFTRH